ncbi:TIR domain-containing protein [Citrus sinensis]|uniref:TIR domain-containing protein n=1 Tax=Citrus sinensis TaxID=2711 RepID=A0ACB8M826_CITSI|nr:TIR domain-containing protein [Citrus sinensis]
MSSFSSSSSSSYDVFLNFRREDTGDNFTSHLHHALRRNKIKSFTYDDLNKGHDIMASLFEAIEGSRISIIIFSKNYASSESCLDELVKIIECKKVKGQIVIPIFYHVRPSDVRCQTGSFEDAFVNHEQHSKRTKEKLERWRGALMEASDLCGWDSSMIRPESKLVEEIVGDILNKLNAASPSSNFRGRIQTNSSIDQQMDSTVSIGRGRSIRRRGGKVGVIGVVGEVGEMK